MHFSNILIGCAALLPAALAAPATLTPPTNFILQAQPIKGVSKSSQFNKDYMSTGPFLDTYQLPLFSKLNSNSQFFRFSDPVKTPNGTFYSLLTNPPYLQTYIADMDYSLYPDALWAPVNFGQDNGTEPTAAQTGFYIGGTTTDMKLMWTENYKEGLTDNFGGWLLCNWWFGSPQLFFVTSNGEPVKGLDVPSSCEVVYLQVIPAVSS